MCARATTSPSCTPPSATCCTRSLTCTATTPRRTRKSSRCWGTRGAGKTHLLHSIKHGGGSAWQMLVTPGVYQKESDFLEYLLFQILDTLLGGGRQKSVRPMEVVGPTLVRTQLAEAIRALTPDEKIELFPPPGIGKWGRRLGLGGTQATERRLARRPARRQRRVRPRPDAARPSARRGRPPNRACFRHPHGPLEEVREAATPLG